MQSLLLLLAAAATAAPQAALAWEFPTFKEAVDATSDTLTPDAYKAWYSKTYVVPYLINAKVRPLDFRVEAALLLVSLAYVAFTFVGRARNKAIASRWAKVAEPMLRDEFATVGAGREIGVREGETLVWNGGAEAVMYATGRRGVDSLHAHFTLAPWHDPLALLYYAVGDIVAATTNPSARDLLTLRFALPFQTPDNVSGVFAIVAKTSLRVTRKGRFDLTFAKLADDADSVARGLDKNFAVLSETTDMSDTLLGEAGAKGNAQREKVGLQSAINGPAGRLLESLVLSDQPNEKPEYGPIPIEKRTRTLVLTLRAPTSVSEAKDSLALVEAACNLLDAMELGAARTSTITLTKLRKTRAEVDKQLLEEATREQREEEEEAKASARRSAEKLKLETLSPKEQEKRKEIERKRLMRKQVKGKKLRG